MSQSLSTNQTKSSQTSPKEPKKMRWLILSCASIILILIGIGVYSYISHKKNASSSPATYMYKNYIDHTVGGTRNGMSFIAPSELKQIAKTTNQLDLGQTWVSDQAQGVTYIVAMAQTNTPNLSSEDISKIDNSLTLPNDPSYQTITKPINYFVLNSMIQGWQIHFNNANKFDNANVKEHAWSVGFNANPSKGSGRVEGRVVYVVTGTTSYYLLIYSNSHNWQANIGVWQKVFNSLVVDR